MQVHMYLYRIWHKCKRKTNKDDIHARMHSETLKSLNNLCLLDIIIAYAYKKDLIASYLLNSQ